METGMTRQKIDFQAGTNPFFLVAVIGGVMIVILITALLVVMKSNVGEGDGSGPAKESSGWAAEEGDGEEGGKSVADAAAETIEEHGADDTVEPGEVFEEEPVESEVPGEPGGEDEDPVAMLEAVKKEISDGWEDLLVTFKEEGITVDLEKKQVAVKGAIIRDKESRRYPIEYVVVSEGGNTHEAMVLIKATPSNLNAALLATGLEPGKTVIFRKKDPPPPAEDVESGKASPYEVVPPEGTLMNIDVIYEGWEDGKSKPLEDLILDIRTNQSLKRVGWIYVGSRFARVLLGRDRVVRYMADMERNVVALYLTGYGNAIFDVNTADGVDDSLFDVNPKEAPPMGAEVTLVFTQKTE